MAGVNRDMEVMNLLTGEIKRSPALTDKSKNKGGTALLRPWTAFFIWRYHGSI